MDSISYFKLSKYSIEYILSKKAILRTFILISIAGYVYIQYFITLRDIKTDIYKEFTYNKGEFMLLQNNFQNFTAVFNYFISPKNWIQPLKRDSSFNILLSNYITTLSSVFCINQIFHLLLTILNELFSGSIQEYICRSFINGDRFIDPIEGVYILVKHKDAFTNIIIAIFEKLLMNILLFNYFRNIISNDILCGVNFVVVITFIIFIVLIYLLLIYLQKLHADVAEEARNNFKIQNNIIEASDLIFWNRDSYKFTFELSKLYRFTLISELLSLLAVVCVTVFIYFYLITAPKDNFANAYRIGTMLLCSTSDFLLGLLEISFLKITILNSEVATYR